MNPEGDRGTTATIAMKLSDVIPWGRSLDEYRLMFGLSERDLAGRILGCGDGPASFNSEATAEGFSVTSCDPIYAFSTEEIRRRVEACYEEVISQVRLNPEGFVWDYFHDPDRLGQARLNAMRAFLSDLERGKVQERYVTASLPSLPFRNGQFDLALCSHLLFLWKRRVGGPKSGPSLMSFNEAVTKCFGSGQSISRLDQGHSPSRRRFSSGREIVEE